MFFNRTKKAKPREKNGIHNCEFKAWFVMEGLGCGEEGIQAGGGGRSGRGAQGCIIPINISSLQSFYVLSISVALVFIQYITQDPNKTD